MQEGEFPKVLPQDDFREPEKRYQSREQISQGGMKRIVRVRDRATVRDVAMAVLNEESLNKAGIRERFVQEARITANLEHPNIVPIHDIGVTNENIPFFTMKMLGGETLAGILKKLRNDRDGYREKYPLAALLMIYLKILDAIAFAHAKGIIHLDVKPENIQVGEFGEVVVLDWGLARSNGHPNEAVLPPGTVLIHLPEADISNTADGEIKGTVGYMAPEQAAGRNREKDERTDIYALGAILYAMLCWRRSVCSEGKDTEAFSRAIHDITSGQIRPVENPDRPIPSGLVAVVRKAMSLKPSNRYETVGELKDEILDHLNGFATRAEKASCLRRVALWFKRHKTFTVFLFLVTVGALLSYTAWDDIQTRRIARWGHQQVIIPFLNENAMHRWIVHEGEWEILPDRIRSKSAPFTPARIRLAQPVHGNIAVEFDAMIESREALEEGGDLTLVLNWNPNTQEDGYFFQLGGLSNTVAAIQRRNGFQATIPFSLEPGKIYHIRVEKEGSALRLFCNGEKIIESEEMFYLEGGYLGFYTFGGGKRFWNVKLYERGVPEWVSPLAEADGYFRNSRSCQDSAFKNYLLNAAGEAYSRVALEYIRTDLGRQAVLRRAYVRLELNEVRAAESDVMMLEGMNGSQSLPLALLRGEVALRMRNFPSALDIFSRALSDYPGRAGDIIAMLTARISDPELFKDHERYRNYFWRMAVEHQQTLSFRCRTKSLTSIDFFRTMNFEMLDFSGNRIRDLTPLEQMRLKELNCSGNPVSSLRPLSGMKLETLDCSYTAIGSIEPLRGMPLKKLYLHGCPRLQDLHALVSLDQLERLTLPEHIPYSRLAVLKNLPNLKSVNNTAPDSFLNSLRESLP